MTKTLITLGIIGTGIYLAKDRIGQWLSKVQIGFKTVRAVQLDWERSTVKPVIWILNGNSTPVILKKLSGKVVYPTINAGFSYDLGDLLLEPGQKVDAAFSIRFENEDPFVLLADRLQKNSPIPVEGTVELILRDRPVKLPFSYSL